MEVFHMLAIQQDNSTQQNLFDLIKAAPAASNLFPVIPPAFISFTGDKNAAALLSQLSFWDNKGRNPFGWIFKTFAEWEEELGLSRLQVHRAAKILENMGLLERKIMKTRDENNKPTGLVISHYRLDSELLINKFSKYLETLTAKSSNSNTKKPKTRDASLSHPFNTESIFIKKTTTKQPDQNENEIQSKSEIEYKKNVVVVSSELNNIKKPKLNPQERKDMLVSMGLTEEDIEIKKTTVVLTLEPKADPEPIKNTSSPAPFHTQALTKKNKNDLVPEPSPVKAPSSPTITEPELKPVQEPIINANDFETLKALIPVEKQTKAMNKILRNALTSENSVEFIKCSIEYANKVYMAGKVNNYNGYLISAIKNEWGADYQEGIELEAKSKEAKKKEKDLIFLNSRRSFNNDYLKYETKKGCKACRQVLVERGEFEVIAKADQMKKDEDDFMAARAKIYNKR